MRFSIILALILCGITQSFAWASGNSLLSVSRDGKLLLVANPDNGTVSVVDTSQRTTLREIPVGKRPRSVAWIGQGPLAIASCYLGNEVVVFDASSGKITTRIETLAEPYGVVVDRAGKFGFVTNEYPGTVTEIDLERFAVSRVLQVGPYIRGIALTSDERRILVTHYYTGWLSALDRKTGKLVDQWVGSKSDNLARQVTVHPTLAYAYVPHIRSRTERAHGSGSIFPYLSVIDLVPPGPLVERARLKSTRDPRRHTIAMDSYNGVRVTANPWETAISPDGKRNYTIYAGTNDMNVSQVIDDHYRYIQPAGGLIRLGNNPRAVTVSPDSQTVYVYNTLDFSVAIFAADPFGKIGDVKVCEPPYSKEILRGKILFESSLPPMTRRRWISCSSCHPDGDHDGRVWQNPEGLRRTTHFFGMARTYPIHWSADRDEMQDFEHTIRGPLMGGRGLIDGPVAPALGEPNAGRSADLDALAEYCNSLEHRLSPHASGPGKLSPAAKRGKKIFFSQRSRCAECHRGPEFTDRKVHDVGTGSDDPSEKIGPLYDTPSLNRVYRNIAYLHHGKARTLEEVMTKFNPQDEHGKTSHLSDQQIADLVEFLESLPYELDQ